MEARKLGMVVNNPPERMSQEQYEKRVGMVWSFGCGVMLGLVMAAWMALGR